MHPASNLRILPVFHVLIRLVVSPGTGVALAAAVTLALPVHADTGAAPTTVEAYAREARELDLEIAFWHARAQADASDSIAPTKLGLGLLTRARERGTMDDLVAADRAFAEALGREPGNYTARVGQAFAAIGRHQFARAIDLAEAAIESDPAPADAYAAWFDASLESGHLERARRAHERLVAKASGGFVDLRSANLAHALGYPKQALDTLERSLSRDSRSTARVAERARMHLVAGEIAMQHGQYSRAERHFERAREGIPGSEVPLEHLAELATYRGRFERALALYENVLELSNAPEFHDAIAAVYASLGEAERANAHVIEAARGYRAALEQGNIGYQRALSRLLLSRDPEKALHFAQLDLGVRQDAQTWQTLAEALLARGEISAARAALGQAFSQGTRDAALEVVGARVLLASGCPAQARVYLERALALHPRYRPAQEALRDWDASHPVPTESPSACPSHPRIRDLEAARVPPSRPSRAQAVHRTLRRIRDTAHP